MGLATVVESVRGKLGLEVRKPPTRDPVPLRHLFGYARFKCAGFDGAGYEMFVGFAEWRRLEGERVALAEKRAAIESGPASHEERLLELRDACDEARDEVLRAAIQFFTDRNTIPFLNLLSEHQAHSLFLSTLREDDLKEIVKAFPDGLTAAKRQEMIDPLKQREADLAGQQRVIEKRSEGWVDDIHFSQDWEWRRGRCEEAISDWAEVQAQFIEPVDLRSRVICLAPVAVRKTIQEAYEKSGIREHIPKKTEGKSWGWSWEKSAFREIIETPVEIAR